MLFLIFYIRIEQTTIHDGCQFMTIKKVAKFIVANRLAPINILFIDLLDNNRLYKFLYS